MVANLTLEIENTKKRIDAIQMSLTKTRLSHRDFETTPGVHT